MTTARLDLATENPQGPYPPLRLSPLRVSEFCQAIVTKFRRQHPSRTVSWQLEGDCTIMGDGVMLAHAVANILDNAQKYSGAPTPIEFYAKCIQATAALVVRDHGIGISAEDLTKVCTPFFRADPSRTRGTGGVGLGLAFAKRLIESHGGSISIESKLGGGTQVTMILPIGSDAD
jgi:signal transduction histidine kinase